MKKLIPRLNYDFGLNSLLLGVCGIFKSSDNNDVLNHFFGNENIFLTNQARTGLRILLNSLGLKPGDSIGVQAYNCNTVFSAINRAGYKIVFIDVNQNFTIDIDDLKKKAPIINALIVTHIFGIPAGVEGIRSIVGIMPIIEDCAHSFLSREDNIITGKAGDAAIFSIGNSKFPSIGEGGIVVINNQKIVSDFITQYKSLNKYSFYKELSFLFKNYLFYLAHKPYIYGLITIPFLKKLDERSDFGGKFKFQEYKIMQSMRNILFSQIKKSPHLLEKQKKNALEILEVIPDKYYSYRGNNKTECNYFMIPLLVESPEDLIFLFRSNGIEIGRHFSQSIEWAKSFGYVVGSCPMAEKTVQKLVCIPCHYNLREFEIAKIKSTFQQL